MEPSESGKRRQPCGVAKPSLSVAASLAISALTASTQAFRQPAFVTRFPSSAISHSALPRSRLFLFAPPGSGYAQPEDETSFFPDTYEPMMEYPGTMRPGRTPENIPFHDLPIADTDPDPVPWPHFQQIEWHHRWEPPHEHPMPMEEFIEMHGRWATPEFEASMRAGVRRNLMEQRQTAEAEKKQTIITDDEEDQDDEDEKPVGLGEGIFGQMGSATKPKETGRTDQDDEDSSAELDDFLLDLGLDLDMDDSRRTSKEVDADVKKKPSVDTKAAKPSFDDSEEEDDEDEEEIVSQVAASMAVDDDSEIGLDMDDDDELEESAEVPLEEYGDSDSLDTEDIFGEGGFDFDDGDFDAADGFDMDDW